MSVSSTKPVLALPEQCEAALRSVLSSEAFARAEKMQRFLRFVSELTFRGEANLIHEHLIAVQVFGRGDDYSPGEDSVVRRQAHALRRKLKQYYETEGKDDPIQIDLPLGTYVPVFRERQATPHETKPAAAEDAVIPAAPTPRWVLTSGAILLGIALFVFGWTLGGRSAPAAQAAALAGGAVREIWEPWFAHGEGAYLCFSNPPGTSVRQFDGPIRPNPEHQGISVTGQQDAALRRFFHFPDGGNLYLYPLAAQAKMGEALAAVSLASFLTRSNLQVKPIQSRFVTWETMRQQNMILLGHADSNPWVEPVLRSAPFVLAPTNEQHRARIVNLQPQPGEQAAYFPTLPEDSKSYALVSMLAGVDGSHQSLVIGGLDTSSTAAAAEYLIHQERVADLLRRLRAAAPGHQGPWRFQAVLETDVRDTVALRAFPVAWRVLP